jgi:Putative Flp pilus-assembly TadE/G-like
MRTMKSMRQRGQALILIALSFIGLAAFIGLAVDAGIVFIAIGHLRRAVDSAALSAANQYRSGMSVTDMTKAATEFINLNMVSTATADVYICETGFPGTPPYSPSHDTNLCPGGVDDLGTWPEDPDLCPGRLLIPAGEPYRKFVCVEAVLDVELAFLPIVGWGTVPIRAEATAEAASVDLVLVIDTSSSMSYDLCRDGIDNDEDGVPEGVDDCDGVGAFGQYGPTQDNDPALCNANRWIADPNGPGLDAPGPPPDGDREDDCHPFEEVRAAARQLLEQMYRPDPAANLMYDRMAVVTFARTGALQIDLADGDNYSDVEDVFGVDEFGNNLAFDGDDITVSPDPTLMEGCDKASGDLHACTNTNTAEGLWLAGGLFGDPDADGTQGPIRQEALWIAILLSDGGANAARDISDPPNDPATWLCPGGPATFPTWVNPACKDPYSDPTRAGGYTRPGNYGFDPDDAARDAADFVGCPDSLSPQPPGGVCPAGPPAGGQGAVIFAIGLGELVTDAGGCWAGYSPTCHDNAGEQLLRYIAGVGIDNDPTWPDADDPCWDGSTMAPEGSDCGNYYFSPTGAGLQDVFEDIASRIFTRLTH